MAITVTNDFELGTVVTFNLYGSAYESTTFTGKVEGITAASGLPVSTSNAADHHFNIYPSLPIEIKNETTDDFRSYYYLVLASDGDVFYLGLPWINKDTLQLTTTQTASVVLSNFNPNDIDRLKTVLVTNGFTVQSTTLLS